MNNFLIKAITSQLQNKGVVNIVKVENSFFSIDKEYAVFFKHNGKIFSSWLNIPGYSSSSNTIDFEESSFYILTHIALEIKHIEEDLFKVEEFRNLWSFMSDWSLANFIFKQLYNFNLVYKNNSFDFEDKADFINSLRVVVNGLINEGYKPIEAYETIMKRYRLDDYQNILYNIS